MALTVAQLITSAALELQDENHIRWTRPELLEYFNAGQRAVAQARPDQVVQDVEIALDAGWQQTLPKGTLALIDISSNATGQNSRITKVKQWQLDAVVGGWRSMPASGTVLHYMHDMRTPNEFLVYPPASVGALVRAQVAVLPSDLVDELGDPSLPLLWMDALRNYVLFRAWSKDAEYGGNAQVAAAHLQIFNTAMGVQAQASTNVAPTV